MLLLRVLLRVPRVLLRVLRVLRVLLTQTPAFLAKDDGNDDRL